MTYPFFSFIIPVYNAQDYLNRCVDSILNQDFRDIQIILVNDGSTDASHKIIEDYKKRYPRIFLSIDQENRGIGPSRNKGFSLATGEYVWFIDNDDWIRNTCLGKLNEILKDVKADILSIGFSRVMLSDGKDPQSVFEGKEWIQECVWMSKEYAILFEKDYPWCKIYRRSFLKSAGLCFPHIYGEDTAEVYRLYASTDRNYRLDSVCYAWCERASSFSSRIMTSFHFDTYIQMLHILEKQRLSFPSLRKEFEYILYTRGRIVLDFYMAHLLPPHDPLYDRLLGTIKEAEYMLSPYEKNVFVEMERRAALLCTQKVSAVRSSYEESSSWRITAPLRNIFCVLRSLLQRSHS